MLNLNHEIVRELIQLAMEIQTQLPPSTGDVQINSADVVLPETPNDNTTYAQAHSLIDDMDIEQQTSLVALMWLGRGDFEIDQWTQGLETASSQHTDFTADYLLSTPLMASYMEEGLAQHEELAEGELAG